MTRYVDALDEANKELKALVAERQKIDTRILRLRQAITTLFRLAAGDAPNALPNKGITEAVREYLEWAAEQGRHVTAYEVRDQLETVGYDFSRHKNPLASVTGTLERLRENGELIKKKVKKANGSRVWAYAVAARAEEGKKAE